MFYSVYEMFKRGGKWAFYPCYLFNIYICCTAYHGSAIKSSNECIRSAPGIICAIRSKVSTEQSRKVYDDMVLFCFVICVQRYLKFSAVHPRNQAFWLIPYTHHRFASHHIYFPILFGGYVVLHKVWTLNLIYLGNG